MKWKDIFTIPDDSLIRDGSVDPMGMQMIWTYFGQQVFQNKLTTVSTDIRNYTINLIHHLVLNKFQQEKNQYFERALSHFPAFRTEYDVKAGLLIFMEDLMVYALVSQKDKVTTRGILGSSNAENKLLKSEGNHELISIHAEKTKGVLVRQVQLGVNGRYKGPFMNMGILSTNLTYVQSEFDRAEKLISKWPEAVRLIDYLLKTLVDLVQVNTKDYPVVSLRKYSQDKELWNLYANCFKDEVVNDVLKDYWEEKLGLTNGAAQSVYSQIKKGTKGGSAVVFAKAFKEETDENEREKLKKILDVEPLLSICSQTFFILADTSVKRIDDVREDLKLLAYNLSLSNVKHLTYDNERLLMLFEYLKDVENNPMKLANAILAYHKKIMENRGGAAWVELENDRLKHYIPQFASKTTEEIIGGGHWYHDYYFWSMNSIYNGLNPN